MMRETIEASTVAANAARLHQVSTKAQSGLSRCTTRFTTARATSRNVRSIRSGPSGQGRTHGCIPHDRRWGFCGRSYELGRLCGVRIDAEYDAVLPARAVAAGGGG